MKKLRKLLAGFMMLVLAITMVPMLAPITANATNATPDTITETTGSLTIHKYEYNGGNGSAATGEELTSLPSYKDSKNNTVNPEPLNDVTFKVTKVADLTDYYTKAGATLPTVEQAKTILASATATKDSFDTVGGYKEVTTATDSGTDGIAKLTDMPLGIYLVQEISAPAQITGKTADFLVSIPMTDVTGDKWLYDVHVYPKNTSTYAGVNLLKQGQIGNGTATSLDDATFILQVKNGTSWADVTTNNKGVTIGTNGTLTTKNGGQISVSDLAPGTYRFVETGVSDSKYIMDGKTTYEFTIAGEDDVDDAKDIDVGDVLINGVETDTAQNPITVINYQPEVEKKVLEKGVALADAKATNWKDAADYSVGDHVTFKVSSTVPENIELLKHYKLVDTMSSGLTMDTTDQASFVVKYYADTTETTTGITTTPTYDATSNKWTLDLSNDVSTLDTNNITSIEVTFTATLTANAVTGGSGNENDIALEYTNKILPDTSASTPDTDNPNYPSGDSDPKEETITIADRVVAYTFGIKLVKTFTGSTPSATVNATFDLYREATASDAASDKVTIQTEDEEKTVVKVGSYTTDANGKIIINTSQSGDNDKAFSNGDYYFLETKTAAGYNLLKNAIKVTVNVTYTQTITTTKTITTQYDASGTAMGTQTESGTLSTTNVSLQTLTNAATGDATPTIAATAEVTNNKGFTLPTTGGVGTYIFIFVGVSMMAAAVILFIISKRKDAAKRM